MLRTGRWAAVVCASLLVSACASGKGGRPAVKGALGPAGDPILRLIADADSHLTAGVAESRQGHLNQARAEFDRVIEAYLSAPGGAYADKRVAQAYRRALETIQMRELEAFAAGDGFRETPAEPAAIDDVGDLPVSSNVPTEDARRLAEEAMAGETSDVRIELNDPVLSSIDLYQGPLRDWFTSALERGGRYLPRIREIFAASAVPQDLAYLALVESAFKTNALSRVKAKGMWQFMPYTGRDFGLTQDWWVDERSSFEKATRAAAAYLRELYETFGDWNLAMAAYNWGPGRVSRALENTGAEDYWTIRQMARMPQETRNYVPMIHAAIVVAKAPEKYGFEDVQPEPALVSEGVPVKGAVDLRVIAECLGTDVDDVRVLNPELRRLATPAHRTFDVKVPKGQGTTLRQCLDRLPTEKRVTFRTHTVARGQTLSTVARLYGTKAAEIAEANDIGSAKRLARGTELIIPIRRSSMPQAPARAAAEVADNGRVRVDYEVRAGDTLTAIATRYRTTVDELRAWNNLNGSRLAAGDRLTVFTRQP